MVKVNTKIETTKDKVNGAQAAAVLRETIVRGRT